MKESAKNLDIKGFKFLEDFESGKITGVDVGNVSKMIRALIMNKKTELEYHQMRGTLINMPKMEWFEEK